MALNSATFYPMFFTAKHKRYHFVDIIIIDKKFLEYGRIGLKFLNFLSNVINCKTQKISFC